MRGLVSRTAVAAIGALVLSGALSPSAGATVRVTSTATDGLVVTDKNGTFSDHVFLKLVSTQEGLRWEVFKTGVCGLGCLDVFQYEAGPGCSEDDEVVTCDRLRSRVTLNLAGGDDEVEFRPDTVSITDSFEVNAGDGNDQVRGQALSGPTALDGGAGRDRLFAGSARDVVHAGAGDDLVLAGAGNDALTGGDGADRMDLGLGADTADGGPGADVFGLATLARDEKDEVNGGIGGDRATYLGFGGIFSRTRLTALRIVEANLETLAGEKNTSENDVLRSIESYEGSVAADIITGAVSSNASDYLGSAGNDTIFGSSGPNTLTGGGGADQLDANAGTDIIDAKAGEGSTAVADPLIDCGDGAGDLAVLDLKDDSTPAGCEIVERAPAREKPHARPRAARVTRVVDGRALFRVGCPRSQSGRCVGTLGLRIGRATTKVVRFSIRRGKSRRVAITLGALERRVGRRTVAQLVSVEPGRLGSKTTLRRVALRGQ